MPKAEKGSSSAQAHYGLGIAVPPPYCYCPQMYAWPPSQALVPPQGVPYSTIYSHGDAFAHPAVPLVPTPSMEIPSKRPDRRDQELKMKLDGMSVSNTCSEDDIGNSIHGVSASVECGIVGSTKGSDGNNEEHQTPRKGGSECMLSADKNLNVDTLASSIPDGEADATSSRISRKNKFAKKSVGSSNEKVNTAACFPYFAGAGFPSKVWIQDRRQLKIEKRKQANRDSAKRSRLRKLAEQEELIKRYVVLNNENMTLKSELNRLTEDFEHLTTENAALLEKLNNPQHGQGGETAPLQMDTELAVPNNDENLIGFYLSESNWDCETEDHPKPDAGTVG